MKIIDCFPFFNELDILEIRLNELYDSVDYFVLVEASKTQSLIDKPFYFEQNKERYSKFLHKIIHVKIEDCPKNSHTWEMENFQRNCILFGLEKIKDLNDEDIIIISDLDEVVSSNSIASIKSQNLNIGAIALDFFVYFFNLKTNRTWIGPIFTKFSILKQHSPQHMRNIKDTLSILHTNKCSGWHFGWMGGFEKMYIKLFSCIEPLDKSLIPEYPVFVNIILEHLKTKKFYNIHYNPNGETFDIVNFTNQEYPVFVENNKEKFEHYFFKE
jgi:beta-1,4-mannosyl-glycoprotein beta-1,4-N-acetylglucosaminyltransferase